MHAVVADLESGQYKSRSFYFGTVKFVCCVLARYNSLLLLCLNFVLWDKPQDKVCAFVIHSIEV